MDYKVIEPIITNAEIIGYRVAEQNGVIKKLKLEDVIRLVENHKTNCEIVLDNKNNKHLLFLDTPEERLSGSEETDTYTIEFRVLHGDSLAGYSCKDGQGNSRKISAQKVWELAAQGKVTNAEATIVNNTKTLIGKGMSLYDLGILKM